MGWGALLYFSPSLPPIKQFKLLHLPHSSPFFSQAPVSSFSPFSISFKLINLFILHWSLKTFPGFLVHKQTPSRALCSCLLNFVTVSQQFPAGTFLFTQTECFFFIFFLLFTNPTRSLFWGFSHLLVDIFLFHVYLVLLWTLVLIQFIQPVFIGGYFDQNRFSV